MSESTAQETNMSDLLQHETFADSNGNERRRFSVRCMQRGGKYANSTFGILDILTNTFVLLQNAYSREEMEKELATITVAQYEKWTQMIGERLTASHTCA